ncbi:shikimate kinase AroK [Candidatus Providencia siddallii]|uniref:Shikimate kinase 1 n=1 Tax=Candidatus Providencia siddallii TaxID=1715285 RepID=A0ABP1CFN2_9GAMM
MTEKRNIILVGPMGSGKTTIGRQLSKQLNMDFFDSDYEIEKQTGVDISWIFDLEGENGFRKREKKIINKLTKKQGIILATGGGTIKLKEIRNRLSICGVVIYLKTSIETQLSRTNFNNKRPLLQINSREILQKLSNERNPMYKEIADITIHTDKQKTKTVTYKVIELLKKKYYLF